MTGPRDDELPDPETENIRNFADLPARVRAAFEGAFMKLDGAAVRGQAVDVNVLSGVLSHFDRLFRIMVAVGAGLEVQRKGRIAEVSGAKHLAALPAYGGSYALPLRLEDPQGELVGDDRGALDAVLGLLEGSPDWSLVALPERVGDELSALLHELGVGSADLKVEAVRNGQAVRQVEISSADADARASQLTELEKSAVGTEVIRGKLFRIDTKRSRIAIDAYGESDEDAIIRITFQPSQLEDLRAALDHNVEIAVEVLEERRPYERTARTRVMSVASIKQLGHKITEDFMEDSA